MSAMLKGSSTQCFSSIYSTFQSLPNLEGNMRKSFIIISLVLFGLSGCASFSNQITEKEPLHKMLNEVKKELRAFKYAISKDEDGDGKPDLELSCGGNTYPIAWYMEIPQIKVTVEITKKVDRSGGGGINIGEVVSLEASRSKTKSDSNSLVLNLLPENIPDNDHNAIVSENGIASNLLAVIHELAQVNPTEPCLKSGAKSTLTLGFSVESTGDGGGGIDLVVFSVEGSKSKARSYSNEVQVTFNFGDAAALKALNVL